MDNQMNYQTFIKELDFGLESMLDYLEDLIYVGAKGGIK